MACTSDSLYRSKCGLRAKRGARAEARLHPPQTTYAQYLPLSGNRLTSEISQKLKNAIMKTAECPNQSMIYPRRTRARCSRRAAAGLPKKFRIAQQRRPCQRRGSKARGYREAPRVGKVRVGTGALARPSRATLGSCQRSQQL